MSAVDHRSTIAVTGAAGFIGGWVVRELLDRGHQVRACVRDVHDDAKVGFLAERRDYEDIVATIDRVLPELRHDPGPIADNAPGRHRAREAEFRAIWAGLELRNDRIRSVLPIDFRPFDDSIRDCVESLLAVAGVQPSRRNS